MRYFFSRSKSISQALKGKEDVRYFRRISRLFILALTAIAVTAYAEESSSISVTVTLNEAVPEVIVIAPANQSGDPGQNIFYEFMVKNNSEVTDFYLLKAVSSNGWVVKHRRRTGTIAPGQQKSVNIQVSIPRNAPANMEDVLTLTATSLSAPSFFDSDNVTTTVNEAVPEVIVIAPANQSGDHGQNIFYKFMVKNDGYATDFYQLSAVSSNGWMVEHKKRTGTIAPGQQESVNIKVSIPQNAPANMEDVLTLTATSLSAPSYSDFDSATTTVNQAARFTPVPVRKQAKPVPAVTQVKFIAPANQSGNAGEDIFYEFMVKNSSDTTDSYQVSAVSSNGWMVEHKRRIDTIAPGQQKKVTIKVSIPQNAPANMEDVLTLTATSLSAPSYSDSNSVTTTVNEDAGVSIRVPVRKRVKSGQTVTLQALIINTSNSEDYFNLTASSLLNWSIEFPQGDTVGPLNQGEKKTVPIEVLVPVDAKKGDTDALTITATSQFDASVYGSSTSILIVR